MKGECGIYLISLEVDVGNYLVNWNTVDLYLTQRRLGMTNYTSERGILGTLSTCAGHAPLSMRCASKQQSEPNIPITDCVC